MTSHEPRPDASNDQSTSRAGHRRRTLLTSAAWAVPATVVVNAAPAFAASCPNPTTVTHPAPVPVGNGPESETSTFIVPDGVTEITYRVVGGQGGRRTNTFGGAGGAEVTGALAVAPGTELTLLVGQGGTQVAATDTNRPEGGQGYGNGGQPGARPAGVSFVPTGGSGGGGSAILFDGAPIVVAGGGGGAGLSTAPTNQGSLHSTTNAGAGGHDAQNARITWDQNGDGVAQADEPYAEAAGGRAASGATGGSGGQQEQTAFPQLGRVISTDSGSAGTSHSESVGGHGGTGGGWTGFPDSGGINRGDTSGGGGGGGYAGGGGGGSISVKYPQSGHGGLSISAGGGGGSNFVTPVPVGSVTPVGTPDVDTVEVGNLNPGERRPGLIELTYDICL